MAAEVDRAARCRVSRILGLVVVLAACTAPSPSPKASSRPTPTPNGPSQMTAIPATPSVLASTRPEVLVGAGDIASCELDGDEATAALLDSIEGTVFTAGDNAYPDGTAAQFRDCYGPTWGRHLGRTRPAPGNHDWRTPDLSGYLGYFGPAAAGPTGTPWYSYELGPWHVIVLDSDCAAVRGCDEGSEQGTWLAADLAASTAACTVAIWHHPRFSSGEHGNQRAVDPLWRALHAAGAELVINGHDHDYERFGPLDADGRPDPSGGLVEIVVGTGGASLRDFGSTISGSAVRLRSHGVLVLTLSPDGYERVFLTVVGETEDAGSGRCH